MTMYVPSFTLHRPTSLDEVKDLAARLEEFDYLGGGTDLLCNYKNQLNAKSDVISTTALAELKKLSPTSIGAGVRLAELESNAELAAAHPVIAETVRKIASPLIRQTATVGGNLLVDTRCYWFNQSPDFRAGLGSCLKAESDECRVVPNPDVCYATYSGDLGPVLLALDARLKLLGPGGEREISMGEFFRPARAGNGAAGGAAGLMPDLRHFDGIGRNGKQADELIVSVEIPPESQGLRAGYMKLRARDSLDFPDAGLALALRLDDDGTVRGLRVVANAIAPTPLEYDELAEPLLGTRPDDAAIDAFGDRLSAAVVPHKNTWFSPKYRRRIMGVFGRRLLRQLLATDAG